MIRDSRMTTAHVGISLERQDTARQKPTHGPPRWPNMVEVDDSRPNSEHR